MSARAAIYLDSNATAPLRPEAREALVALFQERSDLANPSSIHAHGRRAKRQIADARESVALSLGPKTDPEQLVFTSSGTEANQLAVRSVLEPRLSRGEKPHWITTPVEHDSNLQMARWLESRGGSVSFLPVDAEGRVGTDALKGMLRPETALVSAVWVNNETGVLTHVPGLSRVCSDASIPLHLDAAQAWGKLPIDVQATGARLVSFSGHKIGGLSGTGALWVGRGVQVQAVVAGKQEKGRRGGSENVAGIVAMGAAARALDPSVFAERVAPLRERLESAIRERVPGTRVNGGGAPRVCNTTNLSFEGVEGEGLVMALDLAGYSVSSGSACSSGVLEPSHVLLAMGRSKSESMSAVRVSLHAGNTWDELEGFVHALEGAVARIRKAVRQ